MSKQKKPNIDDGLKIIIDNPAGFRRRLSTTSDGKRREVPRQPVPFSLPLMGVLNAGKVEGRRPK